MIRCVIRFDARARAFPETRPRRDRFAFVFTRAFD